MNVGQLQMLRQVSIGTDGPRPLPQPVFPNEGPSGPSFGDTLKEAIGSVADAQKSADTQLEAFVAGEQENLHEVMISMSQAKVQFQLMTEVRNKMLDTYQELMRMQV